MTTVMADDGVRLAYVEFGDSRGVPVVLIAGFKAAATSWMYQVPALSDAGYRVITVDLRGHGLAERPSVGADMARRGRDLNDLLLALDLRGVVLIGGSMGGNTIWSYLSQFGQDRVRSIVIVDQTPKMLNSAEWSHGFYGYDESNIDTLFATAIPDTGRGTPIWRRGMRLLRFLRAMRGVEYALTPGELTLLQDHAMADWRDAIAQTDVPTLFVAGEESEFWPSSHAAAAAALTPRGESSVIRRDGHATNMEQPRAFNRGVLAFLARN